MTNEGRPLPHRAPAGVARFASPSGFHRLGDRHPGAGPRRQRGDLQRRRRGPPPPVALRPRRSAGAGGGRQPGDRRLRRWRVARRLRRLPQRGARLVRAGRLHRPEPRSRWSGRPPGGARGAGEPKPVSRPRQRRRRRPHAAARRGGARGSRRSDQPRLLAEPLRGARGGGGQRARPRRAPLRGGRRHAVRLRLSQPGDPPLGAARRARHRCRPLESLPRLCRPPRSRRRRGTGDPRAGAPLRPAPRAPPRLQPRLAGARRPPDHRCLRTGAARRPGALRRRRPAAGDLLRQRRRLAPGTRRLALSRSGDLQRSRRAAPAHGPLPPPREPDPVRRRRRPRRLPRPPRHRRSGHLSAAGLPAVPQRRVGWPGARRRPVSGGGHRRRLRPFARLSPRPRRLRRPDQADPRHRWPRGGPPARVDCRSRDRPRPGASHRFQPDAAQLPPARPRRPRLRPATGAGAADRAVPGALPRRPPPGRPLRGVARPRAGLARGGVGGGRERRAVAPGRSEPAPLRGPRRSVTTATGPPSPSSPR